jgi:NAD(P)-dependent dehydrogenase (short-subunit alcohol dehydrogenase family)
MNYPTPAQRFDLTDRVAMVTGGSRGLGAAMVRGFAAAGAHVVIASRNAESCRALADEVKQHTGRRALAVGCHVGHWDELAGLVDTTYAAFGKVDVLVNNAGMSPLYPDIGSITEALWDKVFDVNLKGPFRLSQLIGNRMVEAGGGAIINISTAGTLKPRPNIVPYAAAKAGVNVLTEALAHAFGPTVRVNAIVPGTFFSDISKAWDMEQFARDSEAFALRRGGEVEEIVGAALYLASDAASYTTGALLRVDGGYC